MNQKRKNIPAFLRNTYQMLDRQDIQNIVSWAENGNGFLIKDLQKFSLEILPQYFKHKKYTSFVRQLNMYGFHKQRHRNNYNHFAHEHFRKGQIENEDNRRILSQIKRKPEKKKKLGQQIMKNEQQLNGGKIKEGENDGFSSDKDEERSVSLALEDQEKGELKEQVNHRNREREREREMVGVRADQNQIQKQQQSQEQSFQKLKSNNFNHQNYSQDENNFDYLQMTMRHNEILRNIHLIIRQQVINTKRRSLQSLTNESSEQDIQRAEQNGIMKLIEELNQGTIRCNQILQEEKIHEE